MPNTKQLACTIVKETRLENRLGNKIVAGSWYNTVDLNYQDKIRLILPQQLIGMQRWEGGFYGTCKWIFYVFRTGNITDVKNTLPGVYPKVDLLFFCYGATRVKRTLKIIAQIHRSGIEFNAISNEYWLHQHARIQTGKSLIFPYHEKI